MTDALLIIIPLLICCIGIGVLLGWAIWGYDIKYYKCLSEWYKQKLNQPEVQEAILEKRIKDVVNNNF